MIEKQYIVGVTGHRDLKVTCIKYYKTKVFELLKNLQKKHKDLVLYSPLADGADRLVVKEAQKLDIPYIAILPMKKEIYMTDFDLNSTKEFNYLFNTASKVITMGLCKDSKFKDIGVYGKKRDAQYEIVGHRIADLSDALIALWNGKNIGLMGGTGEIVKYFLQIKFDPLYHLLVSRSEDVQNYMVEFKFYNDSS